MQSYSYSEKEQYLYSAILYVFLLILSARESLIDRFKLILAHST